jgi:glycosyltransferase involved in cell wall biosynthesis
MRNEHNISVIIPTHNRKLLLKRTLESLAKQTIESSFEVIVVDDGSSDGTSELVTRVSKSVNYPLAYLHQEKSGPASARNLGLNHAKGEIIAFTDDDCIPEPQWLKEIAVAFRDPEVWAVSGTVWSEIPPGPFVHSLISHSFTVSATDHFMTSNFSVRREIAKKIGLFDTRFKDPWFEDYDFAYRIRARGGKIATVPEARIHHPVQYQPFPQYLRKVRFSQYSPLMQRKYPGKGFGREIKVRLIRMIKILIAIAIVAAIPIPATTPVIRLGFLWLFAAIVAGRRLRPIIQSLGEHSFTVRGRDKVAYLLFSWLEAPLQGIYTVIGIWRFTLDSVKAL